MDVRELAPALLSIIQLFDEANRVLNGDKVFIKLHVKAQTESSFEILWVHIQSRSGKHFLVSCSRDTSFMIIPSGNL